jgi:circadian clock protein KaiC
VRRCVAVLKKRHGLHERAIRELRTKNGQVEIGQPLTEFSGLLTGEPTYHGPKGALLNGVKDETDAP